MFALKTSKSILITNKNNVLKTQELITTRHVVFVNKHKAVPFLIFIVQGVYNWKETKDRLHGSWDMVSLPVDPEVEVDMGSW